MKGGRQQVRKRAPLRLGFAGRTIALVLAGAAGLAAARDAVPGAPWFSEVAEQAGVAAPHGNRSFSNPYARIMEGYTALGAAVAVADYDRDGLEDLFVTDSRESGENHLYRNQGGLRFTDVARSAGVAAGNDAANASADALWFDYDGDGYDDLLVVRFGHNLLYQNRRDGTFREVSEEAGLSRYLNAITAIAFDPDRDGDLDLLLGNYFQPVNLFDPQTPRFFPESFETAANGGGLTLYTNLGDGTFVDSTVRAGLAGHTGWTLDLGHADADQDGDDDLYVAADFGPDRFYLNRGDGTFADATEQAIGIDGKKGMNAEWGDFDGDGLYDVFVTNITDEYMNEGNFLWRNEGDGTFTDVSRETGTHATGWGWGGKFLDYDNDGWLDLYVVNGWVSAGPESYVVDVFDLILRPGVDLADARNWPPMGDKTLSGYQRKRLFRNLGGAAFREEAARHGLDSLGDGRGIAVADLDLDGRLDLFVTYANAAPKLYRNLQPTGHHWVGFELEGRRSNGAGMGARLFLTAGGRVRTAFVNGGNGFAGQSTRRVYFGLGTESRIDRLEVRWPSGAVESFTGLSPDRVHRLVEEGGDGGPAVRQAAEKQAPTPRPVATPAVAHPAVQPPSERPAAKPPTEHHGPAVAPAAPVPLPPASGWAASLFAEGMAAVEAGELAKGIDKLEAAVVAAPDNLRYAAEYRQAIIQTREHERAIALFEKLTAERPGLANLWMSLGYAVVDKIPNAGAITQVILANTALGHFGKALAIEESWLGLYTRGNSYIYWPKIFGRTPLGMTDLEQAVEISRRMERRSYHALAWAALGDGYWRLGDVGKARQVWTEALALFPGDARLEARASRRGAELDTFLEHHFSPSTRVGTDLRELWQVGWREACRCDPEGR